MLKRIIVNILRFVVNTIHKTCRVFGWNFISLSIEDIIKPLAPDERDFLNQGFSEPVRLIIEACNRPSSGINGLNRLMFRETIRLNLKTMAAVNREIAERPDILNTPVDGPLVIVGLARSGTTMLHRLLACDPQFVSPMTWEMFVLTPAGRPENWKNTERYKLAVKKLDFAFNLLPDEIRPIHEFGFEKPEECLMILGHCFMDTSMGLAPDCEKLQDFQINSPKDYERRTYKHYKRALQCIFYGNLHGGKVPLLKSPIHLLHLDTYKEVLPNAKFIFTYRHIETMLASCFSLLRQMERMKGYNREKTSMVKSCLKLYKLSCQKALKTFKDISKDSYITLGYSELIEDPLDTVRRIYNHFNFKLTPEVEASMQRHLVDNPQHKLGKHTYNLDGYGISQEDIQREFKELIEFFKDGPEKLI